MTLSEQHDQDRKHKDDVHGEHDGERAMYERKPTGVSHSCDVQPDGVSILPFASFVTTCSAGSSMSAAAAAQQQQQQH